jgi:hypothetical protein
MSVTLSLSSWICATTSAALDQLHEIDEAVAAARAAPLIGVAIAELTTAIAGIKKCGRREKETESTENRGLSFFKEGLARAWP